MEGLTKYGKWIQVGTLTLLMCLLSSYTTGQDKEEYLSHPHSISAQFIGMAFHPLGGTYPELYHRKLDPKAYFVLELGAAVQYRFQFKRRWALSSEFAYYSDCAKMPAGVIRVGIRFFAINGERHKFNIGLGPALLFRKDWHQLPGYTTDKFFAESVYGKYQYRFYVIPDLEYSYTIDSKWDLFFSILPGGQHVSTSSVGARYNW